MDDFFMPFSSIYKENSANPAVKSGVPVNVTEKESGYELKVVAPGFEKEAFDIKLDEALLTISAEMKNEGQENSGKQLRSEYSFKSFKRSFTLDEKIDAENIAAEYKNGVLTLNLPRKAEVKAPVKNITIQ
ncbi:MAG: Hsp20/alpha crystallin family protein [Chitinophagaceae bacterium]